MGARILAFLALASAAAASGLLTIPFGSGSFPGRVLRWNLPSFSNGRIPYHIQPTPPPGANPIQPFGTTDGDVVRVIRNVFQTWENVPESQAAFAYEGTTTASNALDGLNVVARDPSFTFPPGFPGGITPLITYSLAAGPVSFPGGGSIVAAFPGQIVDADLVVNPAGQFTVSPFGPPPAGTFDFPGVLTHEIGHLLGLDHSGVAPATMYGFWTFSGGYFNRTIETDDRAGLASLYPTPFVLIARGRIQGSVSRPNGSPVFGAQVLALESSSGRVVGAALSGLVLADPSGLPLTFGPGSGAFEIYGLPPGLYDVVVEPLDGPGIPLMSGVFGNPASGASFVATDVQSVAGPSALFVLPGFAVQGINLVAPFKNPTSPNLDTFAWGLTPSGWITPAQTPGGIGSFWTSLGLGTNLVSGGALVPSAIFGVPGSGVTVNSAGAGPLGADLQVNFAVAAGTIPGARVLSVTTAGGASSFAGALNVLPGAPDVTSVAPTIGPFEGGGVVTLLGSDLHDGMLVEFGGAAASGPFSAFPSSLSVIVPPAPGAPGPVEVRGFSDAGLVSLPNAYVYQPYLSGVITGSAAVGGTASFAIQAPPGEIYHLYASTNEIAGLSVLTFGYLLRLDLGPSVLVSIGTVPASGTANLSIPFGPAAGGVGGTIRCQALVVSGGGATFTNLLTLDLP